MTSTATNQRATNQNIRPVYFFLSLRSCFFF